MAYRCEGIYCVQTRQEVQYRQQFSGADERSREIEQLGGGWEPAVHESGKKAKATTSEPHHGQHPCLTPKCLYVGINEDTISDANPKTELGGRARNTRKGSMRVMIGHTRYRHPVLLGLAEPTRRMLQVIRHT
jgi:hypothetical protein